MLRALSERATHRRYERLDHAESSGDGLDDAQLKRVVSVPAGVYDVGFSKIVKAPELPLPTTKAQAKITKKAAKVHPLFGLFGGTGKKKKKMTAMPELSRYIQYLKEGGL
ncbi:hypothetical protein Dimus_014164 [Dionaea muscipula]